MKINTHSDLRKYNCKAEDTIAGMRKPIQDVIYLNPSQSKEFRQGMLSILYSMRSNFLPPAYYREEDIYRLELQINACIQKIMGEKKEK